jgi:AAA domain
MSEPVQPIRPELLAAKIEKIQNFEYPELLEQFEKEPQLIRALWFLQFVSQPANYAGGLSRFALDFIAAQSHRIGTTRMLAAKTTAGLYRLQDAVEILHELNGSETHTLFGDDAWKVENEYLSGQFENWDGLYERSRPRPSHRECKALLLRRLTPQAANDICRSAAEHGLARYFKELCELPHTALLGKNEIKRSRGLSSLEGAPWYFANVADALFAFMEERAEKLRSRLAETEVTKQIRRWTEKSRSMRRPIMFVGNSRFGKSESIELEAMADPGSCRLVETPESNALSDLLREVAKSLGLEVGPQAAGRELRDRIEYVLRFSKLQLIFDEAQFLLPSNYSRSTAPARLNWVRRTIMDRDIPAVFVCTPQSYLPAKRRFVKTTGFAMEQFDERILNTVQLPDELGERDLLAIARIHFRDLEEEYLRFVVDTVLATERNFVSDIEKIAALANDNARERARCRPILADIEAAIADVLPTICQTSTAPQKRSIRRPCKPSAEPLLTPRRGLETLSRDRLARPEEIPA